MNDGLIAVFLSLGGTLRLYRFYRFYRIFRITTGVTSQTGSLAPAHVGILSHCAATLPVAAVLATPLREPALRVFAAHFLGGGNPGDGAGAHALGAAARVKFGVRDRGAADVDAEAVVVTALEGARALVVRRAAHRGGCLNAPAVVRGCRAVEGFVDVLTTRCPAVITVHFAPWWWWWWLRGWLCVTVFSLQADSLAQPRSEAAALLDATVGV